MARLWQTVSDNTNTPTGPSGIRPGINLPAASWRGGKKHLW